MTATETARPGSEAALQALFRAEGLGWTLHRHPALHTVEESRALRGDLPGAHVKNMFLRERKGGLWLCTCREDREIRIRDLGRAVGAKDLSFGKPDLLWEVLGVLPGAVTPLALMNDRDRAVTFVIDAALLEADPVNVHPLHNEATVAVARADLMRFLEITGHTPQIVDFDALEALAQEARHAG